MQKILAIKGHVNYLGLSKLRGLSFDPETEILSLTDTSKRPETKIPFIHHFRAYVQYFVVLENYALILAVNKTRVWAVTLTYNEDNHRWVKRSHGGYNNVTLIKEKFNSFEELYRFFLGKLFITDPKKFFAFYDQSLAQMSFDLSNNVLTDKLTPFGCRRDPRYTKLGQATIWPLMDEILVNFPPKNERRVLTITPDLARDLNIIRQDT